MDEGANNNKKNVAFCNFEESWAPIEKLITNCLLEPLKGNLNLTVDCNSLRISIDNVHFSRIYSDIYVMSTQNPPYKWSCQIYKHHGLLLRKFHEENCYPLLREALFLSEVFFQQLERCFTVHNSMNDRYYVREHNLPSTKDVGDKSFRECVLEPLIKELASFEQSINYSDPQYHLIAVKLLSLSFMSHGADIARNQNFEFMRALYCRRADEWVSLSISAPGRFFYTCRAWESIRETSRLFALPAVTQIIPREYQETILNLIIDELVLRKWVHVLLDFERRLYLASTDGLDLLSLLCRHDLQLQVFSFLLPRDILPLVICTVTIENVA